MAGYFEHYKEPSGTIKDGELLVYLLLKDSVPLF